MNRTFTALFAALMVLASGFIATPVTTPALSAQQTINTTTLAGAVTSTSQTFTLASGTNVVANYVAYVDREMVLVRSITGAVATVTRGYNGTLADRHASGALIYTGPPSYFYNSDANGPCTLSSTVATPRINVTSGNIFTCSDSLWVRYTLGGIGEYTTGAQTTYTTAGAITVKPGLTLIGSSGALAMTLAAGSTQQDGMMMSIFASTAQAHTITATAGFNGGTTARDVCTLGGAIGDGIVIQSWGGVWYVIANRNCTLA